MCLELNIIFYSFLFNVCLTKFISLFRHTSTPVAVFKSISFV